MNIVTAEKLLTCVCLAFAAAVPAKHALHMFQQNRYETGRYTGWIRENRNLGMITIPVLILTILTALCPFFLNGKIVLYAMNLLFILSGVILYAAEKKKKYIKPLVWTARVKRQGIVMAVLFVLFAALTLFVFGNKAALSIASLAGLFLPWILVYPMAWITAPIEAGVRQHYLNDAKRILDEHKDLIKVGITGSFGKTSTKNIMQSMLSEAYSSLMTPASYNTPMGITRTIREYLKPIHQVFVCEMGADHVGDITELMNFVHPSIGVVTSIGPQHLNTFGSQENITREKMQMIEMLPEDGFGVLNYDNEFIRSWKIQNSVKIATYGIHSRDVDYYADEISYRQNGSLFTVAHGEERVQIETKLLGELNILNILSAIAVARHLGVSWHVIQKAAKQMAPVEHRLEPKKINGFRFIDDAFNANPVGSGKALDVLAMMPAKRWIVTPGMIDLGEKQNEINKHFGTLMKDKADVVVLVGRQQTKPIYEGLQESGFDMENVIVVDTVREAFGIVWQKAGREDTILLENDLPDAFNH